MDIRKIIDNKLVKILFQPIISINKKKVIGYESLARGINEQNGELIPPFIIFGKANEQNLLLELDTLCRTLAVEKMKNLNLKNKMLFLNFELSEINNGENGKESVKDSLNNLYEELEKTSISPQNILIEIVESSVKTMDDLKYFTQLCRNYGFMVALDDVGSGHSNLNRIPLIKPDVIKVDRYLATNLSSDYYKQEVYKSITGLSRKIGALVVAEGLEEENDVLSAMHYRADLIQGFYFSKPRENRDKNIDEKINLISQKFRSYLAKTKTNELENISRLVLLADKIELELEQKNMSQKVLEFFIKEHIYIHCLYLIDSKGFQISDTVFNGEKELEYNKILFSPGVIGTDHSLKTYYYQLKVSSNKFHITDQYISMATGDKCMTFSKSLHNGIILAIDIDCVSFCENK